MDAFDVINHIEEYGSGWFIDEDGNHYELFEVNEKRACGWVSLPIGCFGADSFSALDKYTILIHLNGQKIGVVRCKNWKLGE